MKRFAGKLLGVVAYVFAVGAFTIPVSVFAIYYAQKAGHNNPEAVNLLASMMLCMIAVFLTRLVKVPKMRALWDTVFGFGIYAAAAYFCIFGACKDTISILTPFKADIGNDVLIYIGAGALLLAIVLAVEGRALVRAGTRVTEPVSPKIVAEEPVLPASALPAAAVNPVVSVQPILAPYPVPSYPPQIKSNVYADGDGVVRYMRDEHGNLIAYEEIDYKRVRRVEEEEAKALPEASSAR